VARRSYLPFGAQWAASGSLPTDFGFTGQREADEIGLYYYVARWLDPEIGHFAQADTILDNFNRYAYVAYNPLKYTDPGGHQKCVIGDDGVRYCYLENGMIIDSTHYEEELAKEFWDWLINSDSNKFTFTQGTYGHIFSVTYQVEGDLTSLTTEQRRALGAQIWLDYQNRFEQWQSDLFWDIPGSSFSPEDIPSTYLAYAAVSATHPDNKNQYTFSDVVNALGGGYGMPEKPSGFNGTMMYNNSQYLMSPAGERIEEYPDFLNIDQVETETTFTAVSTTWGRNPENGMIGDAQYWVSRLGNAFKNSLLNFPMQ
jgi:RHS repeat-associated protein